MDENDILAAAVTSVEGSAIAFSKYITANDTGNTGSHQAGFHIPKNAWPAFFDTAGVKGSNKDFRVTIKWQGDFETESRFIYYGTGTRNEYRLTRFGRAFPFLTDDHIGDLLIVSRLHDTYYEAFVLSRDEDIDGFLSAFNMSATEVNGIIPRQSQAMAAAVHLSQCFQAYIQSVQAGFPSTAGLAAHARDCYMAAAQKTVRDILLNPDRELVEWVDAEFSLFRLFERNRYAARLAAPFGSLDELIETANTILNRRKSRAGKSLEHHLSKVFDTYGLLYETQAVTEDNKKPDFLFPGAQAYHTAGFPENRLVMLAAKTTCKDRWRQILNEADRIPVKHLFTLQQGISSNQLQEMQRSHVRLVVPEAHKGSFPVQFRNGLLSLHDFISSIPH